MSQFLLVNSDAILRLMVAMFLGMLIGAERLLVHKEAGMKTHALVSLGAALFILVSETLTQKYMNMPGLNPAMMASQIIVGIGFVGAGSIIRNGSHLIGLTTAGGLWVTAGIGMAAGYGLNGLAIISTVLVLIILTLVNIFEAPIRKMSDTVDPI